VSIKKIMAENKQAKKEFGYFWQIILVFLALVGINLTIKYYVCDCIAWQVSFATMGGLLIGLTGLYFLKLKPKLNQIILFFLSCGFAFSSIVFFVYDLPYKKLVGGISLPLILVFCAMWLYTRFKDKEVK
jgi:hypothetical protein